MSLLAIRNKRRKIVFKRLDSHKKKRIAPGWRKPRGFDAKLRRFRAGRGRLVGTGYGAPVEVRGLSPEGLKPRMVCCMKDLTLISEGERAIISTRLGMRKKLDLLREMQKKDLKALNIPNVSQAIQLIEKIIQERKDKKKQAKKAPVQTKKKDLAEKVSDEEKKEREKKEKDKLLIKREIV